MQYGYIPALVFLLNMGIYLDRTLIQLVYIRIRTIDTSSTGTGTGTSTVPVKKKCVPYAGGLRLALRGTWVLFFNIYVLFRYRIGTGRV